MSLRPVVVTIPTFKRGHLLPALLATVREQISTLSPPRQCRVALVDNDPEQSARQVAVDERVDYYAEPRPGIAATRQRALDAGEPDELLVMIDDDVEPETGWLSGLLSTWEKSRPTVVMGFVHYVWPADADPLIAAGGFMRRRWFEEGTSLEHVATGNVLIDVGAVRGLGVAFDLSLGLGGGEDLLFGKNVLERGGTVVASASTVRDEVPPERTTWDFVRQRTIGHGQTRTMVNVSGSTGFRRQALRAWCLVGGIVRWVVFTGWRVAGRLRHDVSLEANGIRRSWFAIGRIQGAIGVRTEEYSR